MKGNTMTTYNGYTNYETWNFALHYSDYLQETIQELQNETSERLEYGHVFTVVNGEIDNILEEMDMETSNDFIRDVVGIAIQRLDIHQIVSNIHEELEFEEIE